MSTRKLKNGEKVKVDFITGDTVIYEPDMYSYNNNSLELYYEHNRFYQIIPIKNIREITIKEVGE